MTEVYSPGQQPLVAGDKSLAQVTQDVCAPLERRSTALWVVASTGQTVSQGARSHCWHSIGWWATSTPVAVSE